jgi:hypothetical protein
MGVIYQDGESTVQGSIPPRRSTDLPSFCRPSGRASPISVCLLFLPVGVDPCAVRGAGPGSVAVKPKSYSDCSNIRFRPHAMRVGLKLSSALRAPRRARWRRPRHRGPSFSFPHPPSPQDTHRIYLVRHAAISIIFPPGSIFSGTYGSTFPSPYPICGHRARSRAFVVSSLRISSIPSAIVRPPGGVVLLPVAHSPRVNHTGRASAYPSHLSRPL